MSAIGDVSRGINTLFKRALEVYYMDVRPQGAARIRPVNHYCLINAEGTTYESVNASARRQISGSLCVCHFSTLNELLFFNLAHLNAIV